MSKLRHLAELDLHSTMHPLAAEIRRAQIQNESNMLRRAGAFAVNRFTTWRPQTVARLLGADKGIEPIGFGVHMAVVRDGAEVIKFDHASMQLSESDRQAAARERERDHAAMTRVLGETVIPETVTVGPHPFLPTRRVVQVRQPYINFADPMLFEQGSDVPIADSFDAMRTTHPTAWDELNAFLDKSQELLSATGSLPDTSRHGNLVITPAEKLAMIDGQPILMGDPTQDIITSQHRVLASVLSEAA